MIVLRPDLATPEFMADEPNVTPPSPDFLMRQSSEFRVYSSLPTANRLSWPYKPCLASSFLMRQLYNLCLII